MIVLGVDPGTRHTGLGTVEVVGSRERALGATTVDLAADLDHAIRLQRIYEGVLAAIERDAPTGAYNLGDDMPASSNAVTEEACRLLGVEPPPLETLEEANLSEMARGFYSENRRVANGKAKRVLGWAPRYATFKEGLVSLV